MRLTLINQFYTPDLSPTAHLCASLAKHRAKLGDEVTVLTGDGGYLGPIAAPNSDDGIHVRRLWTSRLGSRTKTRRFLDWATFYFSALKAAARLPSQDVIIALTTPPFIAWAGVIQKYLNPDTRLILWNMDCWPDTAERLNMIPPGGLVSQLMRRANRALFHELDHLICLDSAMANLVLSQYAPSRRVLPTSIIPNWEDAAQFPRDAAGQAWDDPIVELLKDRFVVLYLGNAGYGHEFQTLLNAAEQLRDAPITFLFVGGGAHFDLLRTQSQKRGLTSILLHDYVAKDQTPAVMRAADCALITLEDYALGVMSPSKLHANLAMGLPVFYVGPEASNVDQAIVRFGCGSSLRIGQSAELANAIHRLASDRAMQHELQTRARKAFDEAYCDLKALPLFDAVLDGRQ